MASASSITTMNVFWDQRFAGADYKYGTEPNVFLAGQAHRLCPGARVLVPGDGEGRNGVWLAAQGHHVLSMDSSAVGLAKARRLAERAGATLDTVEADLADWAPAPSSADAVALIFVHLPSGLRRHAHRRLAMALRPGGWLILECFHPRQLGRPSGGPREPDMLATLAQLRQDFMGLCDEAFAFEGEVELDEGSGHHGTAVVTRWVGHRRATTAAAR